MSYLDVDFSVLLPAGLLVAGALACLVLEFARPALRRLIGPLAPLTVVAAALSFYAVGLTPMGPEAGPLAAEVATDPLALALAPAFFLSSLGALLLAGPYLLRAGRRRGEFPALVLFSTAGMLLLVQARDLLVLFLALETLSIPLYVLTGFLADRKRSLESALKYFTIGAFSSAFVAFGLALTYGAAGTLDFAGAREALASLLAEPASGRGLLAHGGLAFLLVGFGFKVGMVPFHAWAPDVYEGAPTPVTAFLGVGSKAAGLAGLLRLLLEVFPGVDGWLPLLTVLAALTLVVGNTVAMLQENVKRLLAYSGVSHAGFLLMGVLAHQATAGPAGPGAAGLDLAQSPALRGVVFYVLAYSLMTLGALAVVAIVERDYDRDAELVDYAGLASRRPLLAVAMLVFLLSLGGMPPLAGFLGKWLVFKAALDAGLVWLAVVAAVTSVIGFYYYLRVVREMYLEPSPEGAPDVETAPPGWVVVGAALAGTILLGLLPWLVLGPLSLPVEALAALAP